MATKKRKPDPGKYTKREIRIMARMQKEIDDLKCQVNNVECLNRDYEKKLDHAIKRDELLSPEIKQLKSDRDYVRGRVQQSLHILENVPHDANRETLQRMLGVVEGQLGALYDQGAGGHLHKLLPKEQRDGVLMTGRY